MPNRVVFGVIATENMVDVFDRRSGRIVPEVLLVGGVEVPNQVPLLADHKRSVSSVIGSVTNFTRAGSELKATLSFASGTASADEAWGLIQQKHLRDVSVGYIIRECREISPGKTEVVAGRSYTAPTNRLLRVVTKWRIKEVSLVPIGADENSGIRAANHITQRDKMNSIIDVIGPAARDMNIAQYLSTCARHRGRELDRNADDGDVFRSALSHVEGVADMLGMVNQAIVRGFRETNDTTSGWVRTVDLPNFLASEIAAVSVEPRLEKIARGGVSPTVGFGVAKQGWRLARFGAKFQIDERDVLDGRPLQVYQAAIEEVGKAARRLVPDLVYSLLLANPTLASGVAIFDASRNNNGTAALAQASLDAGLAAVANQTRPDREGDPVHVGNAARYLVTPPNLFGTAKRLARAMQTGDGDLIVRAESRIGSAGVLNPTTDEIVSGLITNWLLTSPTDRAAGVVVGALSGRMEPKVREFVLDGNGEYGIGFDVCMDLAATVVGPASMYFSDGTV